MNSQKILVVYFSRSGHTRILANEISRELQSDIEEIKTSASYSGLIGYQRALIHAAFKRKPVIRQLQKNPADYDLVIIGSPLWGSSISGPVRSFLERYKNELNNVAFFLTQGGLAGRKHFFDQMKTTSQKKPLAFLAVSEKALNTGEFKEEVATFLSEIRLSSPKIERKRAKIHRPETTISP